jgi:hypothetical protein
MRNMLVLLFLFLIPNIGLSQVKVPIYLDVTANENDQAGQQMAFEIKEAIRGSHGFRLVEDSSSMPYMRFVIVTVRAGGNEATAASYSLIYESLNMPVDGAFITSSVQYCGRQRVAECARGALSILDRAVNTLQQRSPELRRSLR